MQQFRKNKQTSFIKALTAVFCTLTMFLSQEHTVLADRLTPEERLEIQRAIPIESNQVPNWPAGPVVGADSAILIEAETGTILYEKNIHQREYPASTTKILTALIASERCDLDEIVTFSHDAVFDTPRDSSHIAMDVGQELTMEQCLNAMLIRSANEVCFATAEHITGTTDWSVFADIMNERAGELGCLNSHFANPNGLPDENHYTTAYDLAMIGRAFFANEMLCKITLTRRMEFPATEKLPQGKLEVNLMKIIPGGEYAYEYLVGCKTGYTDDARSCLVSCAEKDGLKLICVVMKDEAPYQYEDTISLFNYGFSNFDKVNVSQAETKYNIDDSNMFYSGNDIFGSSQSLLALNKDDYIILPRTASFEDVDSAISYDTGNPDQAAVIRYTYHGADIGSVRVNFTLDDSDSYIFDSFTDENTAASREETADKPVVFVNILKVLGIVFGIVIFIFIILLIRAFLKNYEFSHKNNRRTWRRDRKRRKKAAKRPDKFKDYDF